MPPRCGKYLAKLHGVSPLSIRSIPSYELMLGVVRISRPDGFRTRLSSLMAYIGSRRKCSSTSKQVIVSRLSFSKGNGSDSISTFIIGSSNSLGYSLCSLRLPSPYPKYPPSSEQAYNWSTPKCFHSSRGHSPKL